MSGSVDEPRSYCAAFLGLAWGVFMCGIVGAVGDEVFRVGPRLEPALAAIAHRGPDGQGVWRDGLAHLGHRRLAIIDLSDAGAQPMVDPRDGLIIVFNGEIYNHLELRKDLEAKGHVFRSTSDTETLLIGYREWGDKVLERCNGMWAFVIWDPVRRRAFAARDRFGVKPFYYSRSRSLFTFASEPKALHILDPELACADDTHIVDLVLQSQTHIGRQTFFRNIFALPPGHAAIFDAATDRLQVYRYWDYPPGRGGTFSGLEEDDQFADLLDDAVRLRCRSDVPVGLTLSGGLDSSAILASASNQGIMPARNYTSVYSEKQRGEYSWAEKAASYAGLHVEAVDASIMDWQARIENVIHHMDSPGYSPAVLPLWSIMQRARADGVPVLLEGQGADELLGGYPQYMATGALEKVRRGDLAGSLSLIKGLKSMSSPYWAAAWLARKAFPDVANYATVTQRYRLFNPDVLRRWRERGPLEAGGMDWSAGEVGRDTRYDSVHEALWRDHSSNILPALLHYGDAISMAHGIESRLPFMDYRLVEWVFRRQSDLFRRAKSKAHVRHYLERRGFCAIANRADKVGYAVPMLDWWDNIGHATLEEMIATPDADMWGVFNRREIQRLAQRASSGSQRHLFHIYKVVTTGIWLRQLALRR